jgi:mono/diheme cytochrome c family protein
MNKLGGIWFLSVGTAALALAGCGGDDNDATGTGGSGGMSDSSVESATGGGGGADTGAEAGPDPEAIARGKYLVTNVLVCSDCHTPRTQTGAPDMTKWLAGGLLADIPGLGKIYAKNITPDMTTGIGSWSDDEIKAAFLDGKMKDGKFILNLMPYWAYHNMTSSDADAIVAYLRSIPAVSNTVPDLPFPIPAASSPIPVDKIPDSVLPANDPQRANAVQGKYLAQLVCIDCHTKDTMDAVPIDLTKLFAGGRKFTAAELGLPPPFPAEIDSLNLTPDSTGIQGWNAEDVKTALKTGIGKDMLHLCPPMPAGPMGAFGGMTDDDALKIGTYLTTLPAIVNDVPIHANCNFGPPPDGGVPEAGDGGAPSEAGDDGGTSDASSDVQAQ